MNLKIFNLPGITFFIYTGGARKQTIGSNLVQRNAYARANAKTPLTLALLPADNGGSTTICWLFYTKTGNC